MKPNSIKSALLDEGICVCQEEPRGRGGLEGFNIRDEYHFQKRSPDKHGKDYFRIYHDGSEGYYEVCGAGDFQKYFAVKG